LRTTISEMGPLLLGSLLELTDSQQSALYAAFKVADREGLLLLDLKDLKALLNHLRYHPELLGEDAALMTTGSSQALLRRLAVLEQQGAEALFGEPALQLEDILHPTSDGRGRIHLLDASRLVHEAPKVYATFLYGCWLNCSSSCPNAAMPINRCWRCFSTKRTYCLPIRPRPCRTASNRWCG